MYLDGLSAMRVGTGVGALFGLFFFFFWPDDEVNDDCEAVEDSELRLICKGLGGGGRKVVVIASLSTAKRVNMAMSKTGIIHVTKTEIVTDGSYCRTSSSVTVFSAKAAVVEGFSSPDL
jgi:hypothetical protein